MILVSHDCKRSCIKPFLISKFHNISSLMYLMFPVTKRIKFAEWGKRVLKA